MAGSKPPSVSAHRRASRLVVSLLLACTGVASASDPSSIVVHTRVLRALTVADLVAGDLVVTEAMPDPVAVDDTRGEYFEIYNASGADVDLNGLVLSDKDFDSYTITSSVVVAAGERAVLGVNGNSAQNGGISAMDVVYTRSLFRLDNGADEIYLSYGGNIIDSFAYGTYTSFGAAAPGAAFNLDPAHETATDNDRAYYWCDASSPYGSGDLGTPGDPNDDCGIVALTIADLAHGDLIITEVMIDPVAVDDAYGEWFEIYNNSEAEVNLYGLILKDLGTDTYTVSSDLVLDVDSTALLAVNTNSARNGGLPTVNLHYKRTNLRMDNTADEVVLSNGSTTIDEMTYTKTSGWVAGASWSLDPSQLDATANDADSAWCAGITAYGSGDLGTPGAANESCPVDNDADDDGYDAVAAGGTDCDDADAAINPGATETCNSVDDNCDGLVDNDASDATTWSLDYDQDTYGGTNIQELGCENPDTDWYVDNADDCDDLDAGSYPGADEVCDGADNDCDDEVDEEALDMATWYADADADDYGDAATTTLSCDAPTGYVDNADDCDDTSNTVYPGADETCDDLDDDCNGKIDDDALDASLWYLDYDDDGYGATKITEMACTAPTYFVDNSTDCDDLDPDISPGAEEVCADGIDNNCDDSAVVCSVAGDVDLADADAKFTGSATTTDAGRGLSAAGDVNGDGYGDLLIGAPSTAIKSAGTSAGAAYLVLGPTSGTTALSTGADATLAGEVAGDQAGYSAHGLGDQDADGFDDIIVGARDEATGGTGAGAIYVVNGPMSGSLSLADADAKRTGEAASDVAGFVVSGNGDIDGDGTPDLVTGAYANATAATGAGTTYVVYGPITGSASLSTADAMLTGEAASDNAGRWASSDGDLDADGMADVVVGAYASDGDGSTADAGRAYVVYGAVSGTLSLGDADAILTGEAAGNQAGYSLETGGDVDGDGYDDLLVGAVAEATGGTNSGAVYLLYGPLTGSASLSTADAKLTGAKNGDHAGARVAIVEDSNGDGRAELLVGAYGEDTGGSNAGAAYIVYGAPAGNMSLSSADGRLIGEAANDKAGTSVATAGDVNGDGLVDFLTGAISEASGGANGGAAYLVLGSGW